MDFDKTFDAAGLVRKLEAGSIIKPADGKVNSRSDLEGGRIYTGADGVNYHVIAKAWEAPPSKGLEAQEQFTAYALLQIARKDGCQCGGTDVERPFIVTFEKKFLVGPNGSIPVTQGKLEITGGYKDRVTEAAQKYLG